MKKTLSAMTLAGLTLFGSTAQAQAAPKNTGFVSCTSGDYKVIAGEYSNGTGYLQVSQDPNSDNPSGGLFFGKKSWVQNGGFIGHARALCAAKSAKNLFLHKGLLVIAEITEQNTPVYGHPEQRTIGTYVTRSNLGAHIHATTLGMQNREAIRFHEETPSDLFMDTRVVREATDAAFVYSNVLSPCIKSAAWHHCVTAIAQGLGTPKKEKEFISSFMNDRNLELTPKEAIQLQKTCGANPWCWAFEASPNTDVISAIDLYGMKGEKPGAADNAFGHVNTEPSGKVSLDTNYIDVGPGQKTSAVYALRRVFKGFSPKPFNR